MDSPSTKIVIFIILYIKTHAFLFVKLKSLETFKHYSCSLVSWWISSSAGGFTTSSWFNEHGHFSTLLIYEISSGSWNSCHRVLPWLFLTKKKLNFPRVKTHIRKAMRNKTQKLSTPSCLDEIDGFGSAVVTGFRHVSSFFLNHASSSSFPLGDSATFRMALDTSATRGDPIGKTYEKGLMLWS